MLKTIKLVIRIALGLFLILSYWFPQILVDVLLVLIVAQFLFKSGMWIARIPFRVLTGKF